MSASSGIGISDALSKAFTAAVASHTVRFLKITIENESLVPSGSVDVEGATLEDDFDKLQDLLEDDVPAYVLARQSDGWLAITYVPETAKVQGKVLYASTRTALIKSLGTTHFPDALSATSKADLTRESFATRRAQAAGPQPLTARERESADARAAERQTGGFGERAPQPRRRREGGGNALVLLSIDAETLVLSSSSEINVEELGGSLPASEPSYAFFAWSHKHAPSSTPRRDIVFIYACPSSSPVRKRMLFSSGASAVFQTAKSLIAELPSSSLASRKIETSDPTELNEAYLIYELGLDSDSGAAGSREGLEAGTKVGGEGRAFAKPRGPGRKPR
ncbi:actin depolymerizing protein [Phellopilus nigrolimitatus]|nr:actin depolymerizing protein [Phellopilus nigrolimitatus]